MEEKKPFITIGIASYNYAHYLRQAFEAIKRQSFRDFEVLYSDDGSTDDSVSLIKSFIAENPNMEIRLLRGENVGVMGNKQRLIDNARGVYLMLCDADDWMDDNCLEVLANAAKQSGADRIVSEIRNIDGDDGGVMYVQSFSRHPSKWCEALHHGALYKLSVIRENHITMPETLPDDFLFVTQFNLFAKSTFFVRTSLYNWRLHRRSESHRNWQNSGWRGVNLLENIFHFVAGLKENYSDYFEQSDYQALNLFFAKNYCFYAIKDISVIRPMRTAREEYIRLRSLMKREVPNYSGLIFKRRVQDSPFRPKIHYAVCILCALEKLHLLFPALMVYGALFTRKNGHSL